MRRWWSGMLHKIAARFKKWGEQHFPADTSIPYIDGEEEFRDELKHRHQ